MEVGYQLLKEVDDYAHLSEFVLYHHEWFDGTGIPTGLKGEEIPLKARMLSITNAYEKMTGERTFKESFTKEEAILALRHGKGTQFDPELVEIFIDKVLPQEE